jgi:hypothetical protein
MKTRRLKLLILFVVFVFVVKLNTKAQIDYTDLSPEVIIYVPDTIGSNSYLIDLNNDEIDDFRIQCKRFYTHEKAREKILSYCTYIDSLSINRISTKILLEGDTVNAETNFGKFIRILGWVPEAGGWNGIWDELNVDTFQYLGLEFHKNSVIHYGWIKIKTNGRKIIIDGFAWNEVPNQLIIIGQID